MALPDVESHVQALPDALLHQYLADEPALVARLLADPAAHQPAADAVRAVASPLLDAMRTPTGRLRIETLLQEYRLDTREGVTLMCLAEALIRIPDTYTAERFLEDRLADADWTRHLGHSNTFWVNASTWGLLLAGKLCHTPDTPGDAVANLLQRLGEPLVLSAIRRAMAIIGQQFVTGETITEALSTARAEAVRGYCHSFDMLGEAALTDADTERYLAAYDSALDALSMQPAHARGHATLSIKLSAFHPRFEPRQPLALDVLKYRLLPLVEKARQHDIPVTLDAEESWRLEPGLEIFAWLLEQPLLRHWGRLGLAVQAYQKRALEVVHWLAGLSRTHAVDIPVRLVKGAYWDSEIKWAQQQGLSDYPVFTRKENTDLHYQICAHFLMTGDHRLQPQFATHNAMTVGFILALARLHPQRVFEFQRLHGMGEALHDAVLARHRGHACRVYSPVGSFRELLPYLVRRLLENGANSSFLRHAHTTGESTDALLKTPAELLDGAALCHPKIPLPTALFPDGRRNSHGPAIESRACRDALLHDLNAWNTHRWEFGNAPLRTDPGDTRRITGRAPHADHNSCLEAMRRAQAATRHWQDTPLETRAALLERIADLFESHRTELMALLMREAGKTLTNAIGEVREAVDFCRYYTRQARTTLAPQVLPGPTGEDNRLELHGRGPMLCISPWNFPLAIFTGQVVAALVAGNPVIAKPASPTPLVALRAVSLMLEAGIPGDVLHIVCASASDVERACLEHPALAGILFTGSHAVARHLALRLAQREGALLPLIAETGGQNAMIVDSSALPEQAIRDIATSAFDSAGQRCSALRVVYLQNEIADTVLNGLRGHLQHLRLGDPWAIDTDIGPVISNEARTSLEAHIAHFRARGQWLFSGRTAPDHGHFVTPTVIGIRRMQDLAGETFGPILHVIRFDSHALDAVIDDITHSGFGLTFGVHTRIETRAQELARRITAGNVYVNRNMIGATVGVQPFGGQGLSGTGPKAGGPHYLTRLTHERTITVNTSASGGNVRLLGDL